MFGANKQARMVRCLNLVDALNSQKDDTAKARRQNVNILDVLKFSEYSQSKLLFLIKERILSLPFTLTLAKVVYHTDQIFR